MSEFPSFKEQVDNFVKATQKATQQALSGGEVFVSPEVQKERLVICSECNYLERSTARCTECGCFVELKSRAATENCPMGKWENGLRNREELKMKSSDVLSPPPDPKEGDMYMFKGKVWQFKSGEWSYVPQAKIKNGDI